MAIQKPKFRIMKNGYDRFEVDEKIYMYDKEISDLRRKISLYSTKLEQTTFLLEELRTRYMNLNSTYLSNKAVSEDISRIALLEANSIIKSAKESANTIIKESLAISRNILADLSKLSNDAENMKEEILARLDYIHNEVEKFKLPDLPDLTWLEEAEKNMH